MRTLRSYYLRTYGCQMNELDSEVMEGLLQKRGLTAASEEEADLLIFNTCWVRQLAARKAMGKIGRIGVTKARHKIIGITGCMANAKKEGLFDSLPHVDFILGTNNLHELDNVLDEIIEGEKSPKICKVDPLFREELPYTEAHRRGEIKAYVSIIRGCDKRCTYCCVPYTRGKEVSRSPEEVLLECQKLADEGFKEIMLLGQNVNSYGKDRPEWQTLFHDLLAQIDPIPGLERLRFMTSHPVDIHRELMEAIRDLPTVCEQVHFPIQAGSDRILKKMHRIYTKAEYLEKVALLRSLIPGVHIGTDIIVGFPTETEEEFEETVEVMRDLRFRQAFLYTYSPREGTPATRWKDDVPNEVKEERLHRLMRLQNQISGEERRMLLGQEVEVLVDRRSRDGRLRGQTRAADKVVFEGPSSLIGTLQQVRLHSCSHETLLGERVAPQTEEPPPSSGLPLL